MSSQLAKRGQRCLFMLSGKFLKHDHDGARRRMFRIASMILIHLLRSLRLQRPLRRKTCLGACQEASVQAWNILRIMSASIRASPSANLQKSVSQARAKDEGELPSQNPIPSPATVATPLWPCISSYDSAPSNLQCWQSPSTCLRPPQVTICRQVRLWCYEMSTTFLHTESNLFLCGFAKLCLGQV